MTAWLLRLHAHDERMLHAVVLRRRRVGDISMHAVTRLGDAPTMIGLSLAMIAGPIPELQHAGIIAATALTSSHLAVQALKRTISRSRPRLPVGCACLIHAPDRFSFPSGHAAASLSVATAMATALPGAVAAAVIGLALLVGVSRCYLGVHYPGDVFAGWLLAIAGYSVGVLLA